MPDSYPPPPSLTSPSLVRHGPERHDREPEGAEQVLARGHRPVPKRDEKLGANGLPRRRNGKQQACEPCRKAKIACDHALPVCERCRRRKVVEKCVYLKAPMTRPLGLVDGRTRSEPLLGGGGGDDVKMLDVGEGGIPLTPSTSTTMTVSPVGSDSNGPVINGEGEKPNPESGPFIKSGGFFGPTNFSAVFLENRENLGNDAIQISNDASEPYIPSYESLQSQTFLMLAGKGGGSPRIALGAKILHALPDKQTCQFLLDRYLAKSNGFVYPKHLVLSVAESLWTTFARALKEPRRADALEEASLVLCKNAEKSLEETETYYEFLESVSGANLRWEIVGQIFAALCAAILSLPERDCFFTTQRGDRRSRRNFSIEMKECVQSCVTLSNYMDLINLPMVSLLIRNLILQTVISGDACLVVWRQLGDLVSTATALGLHRQTDTDTRPVTFLSQTKQRAITLIVCLDLGSSLLTGRPPNLSSRYTRFKLPLDISDEDLMAGGEKLARAVEGLDENGWSKEGVFHPNSNVRASGMLSPVLTETLELYLGDAGDCTVGRINHLMTSITHISSSWPSFLQFKLSDLSSPDCPDIVFFRRLCLRLKTLEMRLLLERLAHKHGILSGQSMVDCAREMLELTVLLWVQRDRFVESHHDYDWMLMCWGIPSSGVLCVELLKQIKGQGGGLRLPRSEIVQNLSLLIGFLEWVKRLSYDSSNFVSNNIKPAAGNYQLCGRMRIIIKRILDQILNPSPPSSNPDAAGARDSASETGTQVDVAVHGGMASNGQVMQQYDPAMFEQGNAAAAGAGGVYGDIGDGLDDFDWLNNVDWSRGPWFDLGQDVSAARWN